MFGLMFAGMEEIEYGEVGCELYSLDEEKKKKSGHRHYGFSLH